MVALRNGTIGWTLAGLELEHGQARGVPGVSAETSRRAEVAAWDVAKRAGVRRIGGDEVQSLAGSSDGSPESLDGSLDSEQRTVCRFDVRTPEEYERGCRPGFRSAPGGQLVQETDSFTPVRGALLVLADDGGGRAAMTGSCLP